MKFVRSYSDTIIKLPLIITLRDKTNTENTDLKIGDLINKYKIMKKIEKINDKISQTLL